MGCLQKKVGRSGSFPRPLHETLKTRDSNRLTCKARPAALRVGGTWPARGSKSAKPRMNSKGWSSWRGRAHLNISRRGECRRLDLPCNCKEWVSTNLARDREPPLRPCRDWRVG